jgi:DNA-binding transcriptional LysR family regulator
MARMEPAITLEIHVASSREILDALEAGAVDAAIVLRHDNRRSDGEAILEEAFGWMAAPDFEHRPGEPLRLATQAEPCRVREMAVNVLDQAGIAWREVFVGGGMGTIVVLHVNVRDREARGALRTLSASIRATAHLGA